MVSQVTSEYFANERIFFSGSLEQQQFEVMKEICTDNREKSVRLCIFSL